MIKVIKEKKKKHGKRGKTQNLRAGEDTQRFI